MMPESSLYEFSCSECHEPFEDAERCAACNTLICASHAGVANSDERFCLACSHCATCAVEADQVCPSCGGLFCNSHLAVVLKPGEAPYWVCLKCCP